jgi:hypothetical protein
MEVYKVVRYRGSHIVKIVGTQIVVSFFSALCAGVCFSTEISSGLESE